MNAPQICPVCKIVKSGDRFFPSHVKSTGGKAIFNADTQAARVCQYAKSANCINKAGNADKGDGYGQRTDKWSTDEELLAAYDKHTGGNEQWKS